MNRLIFSLEIKSPASFLKIRSIWVAVERSTSFTNPVSLLYKLFIACQRPLTRDIGCVDTRFIIWTVFWYQIPLIDTPIKLLEIPQHECGRYRHVICLIETFHSVRIVLLPLSSTVTNGITKYCTPAGIFIQKFHFLWSCSPNITSRALVSLEHRSSRLQGWTSIFLCTWERTLWRLYLYAH